MRARAPGGVTPRDSTGSSLLGRPPMNQNGPRQPRGPGLGAPRRPLLGMVELNIWNVFNIPKNLPKIHP